MEGWKNEAESVSLLDWIVGAINYIIVNIWKLIAVHSGIDHLPWWNFNTYRLRNISSKCGDIAGDKSIHKTRVYTFLGDDILTKLDEIASSRKMSKSELIRIAVEQYITNRGREDITPEIAHLKALIAVKDGEIIHLRSLSNDLCCLADMLTAKVPALPSSQEEVEAKHLGLLPSQGKSRSKERVRIPVT